MDTTKVIVTLLILTIVLSVATVAFNAFSGNNTTGGKMRAGDTATVSLKVVGGTEPTSTDSGNVGLSVVG